VKPNLSNNFTTSWPKPEIYRIYYENSDNYICHKLYWGKWLDKIWKFSLHPRSQHICKFRKYLFTKLKSVYDCLVIQISEFQNPRLCFDLKKTAKFTTREIHPYKYVYQKATITNGKKSRNA
jgi:hypothetical protein